MKHKEMMAEVAELLEAGWREKSLSRHFGVNRNTAAKWVYVFLIAFIFRKSRDKSFGFHGSCFAF